MHTVEIVLLVLMLGAVTGIAARYVRAIPLPLIQIGIGALIAWPQKGLWGLPRRLGLQGQQKAGALAVGVRDPEGLGCVDQVVAKAADKTATTGRMPAQATVRSSYASLRSLPMRPSSQTSMRHTPLMTYARESL